jgi:hypothetical protein
MADLRAAMSTGERASAGIETSAERCKLRQLIRAVDVERLLRVAGASRGKTWSHVAVFLEVADDRFPD